MTCWLFEALPCTPPICRKRGAAPAFEADTGMPLDVLLTQPAAMWSSERPVGFASNFPGLLAELVVELGVSGKQVNVDPAGFVWGSFFCPSAPSKLHSFMERTPRTMSSLLANGAIGASVVIA